MRVVSVYVEESKRLASGREVPNGYKIVRDPQQVLQRLPAGLSTEVPLVVEGNILKPSCDLYDFPFELDAGLSLTKCWQKSVRS